MTAPGGPAISGATAFITGGARGIGLGLARGLADRGARLALVDIDAEALEAARDELSDRTQVVTRVLDVRDREAFAEVADDVERQLGPVSLLFNNAGVAGGCSVTQMTYEHWDWMLGVNLHGVANGIQTFVPRMIQRGSGGYVVNTASGAGVVTSDAGFLYTTAKFGVVGMSEALQRELAPYGIGVSVLCPGPVATDIIEHTLALDPTSDGPLSEPVRAAYDASIAFLQSGTTTARVAELVLAAMDAGRLHVFTDDLLRPLLHERNQQLLDALAALHEPDALADVG